MKYLCLFPLLLLFFITLSPSPALACSGGAAETIQGNINHADLIVKGYVVESDDAQTNATIRVESYVVGTPRGEYLFVRTHDPFETNIELQGRGNPGDCSGFRTIPTTTSEYFLLKFRPAGIYFVYRLYGFREADSTLNLPVPDPNNPDGAIREEFSETEFVTLIADMKGSSPQTPITEETIYPAKSLLAITTSTGRQYYLPVDGAPPVEIDLEGLSNERIFDRAQYNETLVPCWLPENCPQISPDRMTAVLISADTNTVALTDDVDDPRKGEAFLYAPTSDRIAIWNNDQIMLYPLQNPRFGSYYHRQEREAITIQLNLSDSFEAEAPAYPAAWSPDGRWVAYSDMDGLWLKDVIAANSPPRLLIPTREGNVPTARYFSPQSHYLAFSHGELRATLDLNSRQRFADGLVSPDDRTLLAFDLERNSTEMQICILESGNCEVSNDENYTSLPIPDTMEAYYVPLTRIKRVEWADTYEYLVFACKEDDPDLCGVSFYPYEYGRYHASPSALCIDYAYQASTDEIAYLVDDSTVIWNDQQRDLSDYIEGEITDIQWMPSEFYSEP